MGAKSDTWMPLYIADYLRKTMRLTRDQHGGYMLLLMACWDGGGRIPNDPAVLAAIAKASPAEWKKLAPVLLPFFDVDGGELTQARVIAEHAKAARLSEARRIAGSRGGRPPRQTESKQKPIGFQDQKQNETPLQEPIGSNLNIEGSNDPSRVGVVSAGANDPDDWPAGKATDHAAFLAKINPHIDPSKRQGLVTSVGELARWRLMGFSWDLDVIPAVIAHASKPGSSLIGTWTYFATAIARSHADRNRPPEAIELENRRERPYANTKLDQRQENNLRAVAGFEIALDRGALEPEGGTGDCW